MFPYSGELKDLAAPNVYRYCEVKIDASRSQIKLMELELELSTKQPCANNT